MSIFAQEFFNKALSMKKLARAYLLIGKNTKDKLKIVKLVNQSLNCELNLLNNSDFKPACGLCANCKWIETDSHPRTPIILSPTDESKKGEIKVEQIREFLGELSQSSRYFRVVIIEDASSRGLNRFSSTALLKTIEEAKENVLFMLFAEHKDLVLSTIKSRTQIINFPNAEEEEFSDKAKLLYEEFKNPHSRLEQILQAEKFSEEENSDLIEVLKLLQNQFSSHIISDPEVNAKKVLEIESAINDLKSFIKPKAVLSDLLVKL